VENDNFNVLLGESFEFASWFWEMPAESSNMERAHRQSTWQLS